MTKPTGIQMISITHNVWPFSNKQKKSSFEYQQKRQRYRLV